MISAEKIQDAVVREHDSAFSLRIQRIMQMSPPLPSLIIRARVSESFAPRVLRHMTELCVETFVDKLVQGLAEQVRAPDFSRILFEFVEHVFHELFGLLFCADHRAYLVSISALIM